MLYGNKEGMLRIKSQSLFTFGCCCLIRAPRPSLKSRMLDCRTTFTTLSNSVARAHLAKHFKPRLHVLTLDHLIGKCKNQRRQCAISHHKPLKSCGEFFPMIKNNGQAFVCFMSTDTTKAKAGSAMNVFDRKAKRLQRDRTTLPQDYEVYDYLKEEIGFRLYDRICDVKRVFDVAVELGCGRGHVSKHITKDMVNSIYQCELSHKLLLQSHSSPEVPTDKLVVDEEFLPFRDNSLDLVVSNLSLHWVNDVPGCFQQVNSALKNDCAFLGTMFGGETLYQLRGALQLAETEREGGFAPHISPFVSVQDLGSLLNRAGFTMLTIDVDEINVTYPSMYQLMYDLKGMGENNCAWSRRLHLHRDSMLAASTLYKEMYGTDQGIPATFQILYFIGWKQGPNQAKAAERGSGTVSLKDIDKLNKLVKDARHVSSEAKDERTLKELDQFSEELRNKGDKPNSS